jgi:hypothetical protein
MFCHARDLISSHNRDGLTATGVARSTNHELQNRPRILIAKRSGSVHNTLRPPDDQHLRRT